MDFNWPEVLDVIDALVPKIMQSREVFKPYEISTAFFALRNMSDQYPQCVELLGGLAAKLSTNLMGIQELTGQHVRLLLHYNHIYYYIIIATICCYHNFEISTHISAIVFLLIMIFCVYCTAW
jgi:hypothetical protein